jgi:DNA-binding XRE family transcriptional regulator
MYLDVEMTQAELGALIGISQQAVSELQLVAFSRRK